jgi:cyclase
VRTLQDAGAIFDAGADKISINSAAIADPWLITCIAQRFGSQAVIVAIDAKQNGNGFQAWIAGGRVASGKDAVAWAKEAEDRGAGEILLTSMDRDGTREGFDCELTRAIAQTVRIPVIASGGAGSAEDFVNVFREGAADAALAASIFHFGLSSISELKRHLLVAGIPMRFPC